jgi:hypothetical protein
MLREIVEDPIRSQPDMKLIDSGDRHDLPMAIKRARADVVIVAEREGDDSVSHDQILLENPRLMVLVVSRNGREADLLQFRRIPVAEVSPQGLVDAIRAAVHSGTS